MHVVHMGMLTRREEVKNVALENLVDRRAVGDYNDYLRENCESSANFHRTSDNLLAYSYL